MSPEGCRWNKGEQITYEVFGYIFEVSTRYVPPFTLLGSGSSGVVVSFIYSVMGTIDSRVAIKKIPNAFRNKAIAERTCREVKLLRHIHHENVISLKDIICPLWMGDLKDVYIVTDCMDGNLHKFIYSDYIIEPYVVSSIMRQLLRGLSYIHSANILHRDLNPYNIFLANGFNLKIGDFGLARTPSRNRRMEPAIGTLAYRAPELILGHENYTTAVDMWSAGCIFIELMNRVPLFPETTPEIHLELITDLIRSPDDSDLEFLENERSKRFMRGLPQHRFETIGKKNPHFIVEACSLAIKLLMFHPGKRITAKEALKHPFFTRDLSEEKVKNEKAPKAPGFEDNSCTVDKIKDLVLEESLYFNPELST